MEQPTAVIADAIAEFMPEGDAPQDGLANLGNAQKVTDALEAAGYELTRKPPAFLRYTPEKPPTREELIQICRDAIVPQEKWADRDSARAHQQLGEALSLLSAGCDFDVIPDGKTFKVYILYRGFDWFEGGFDDEDRYLSNESYYIPTRARLDEVAGGDWYC